MNNDGFKNQSNYLVAFLVVVVDLVVFKAKLQLFGNDFHSV